MTNETLITRKEVLAVASENKEVLKMPHEATEK